MENNKLILPDQTVSKEYQIPELVDLNGVNEALADCVPGSGDSFVCENGGINNP